MKRVITFAIKQAFVSLVKFFFKVKESKNFSRQRKTVPFNKKNVFFQAILNKTGKK